MDYDSRQYTSYCLCGRAHFLDVLIPCAQGENCRGGHWVRDSLFNLYARALTFPFLLPHAFQYHPGCIGMSDSNALSLWNDGEWTCTRCKGSGNHPSVLAKAPTTISKSTNAHTIQDLIRKDPFQFLVNSGAYDCTLSGPIGIASVFKVSSTDAQPTNTKKQLASVSDTFESTTQDATLPTLAPRSLSAYTNPISQPSNTGSNDWRDTSEGFDIFSLRVPINMKKWHPPLVFPSWLLPSSNSLVHQTSYTVPRALRPLNRAAKQQPYPQRQQSTRPLPPSGITRLYRQEMENDFQEII